MNSLSDMSKIDVQYSVSSLLYIPNKEYEKLCEKYDASEIKVDCYPGFDVIFNSYINYNPKNDGDPIDDEEFLTIYKYLNEYIHFPYIAYSSTIPIKDQIGEQVFERLGTFISYLGSTRSYMKDFLFNRVTSLIDTLAIADISLKEFLPLEEDIIDVIAPSKFQNSGYDGKPIPKYLILSYSSSNTILPSFSKTIQLLETDTTQLVLLKELGILDYLNSNFECSDSSKIDKSLTQNSTIFAELIGKITKVNKMSTFIRYINDIYHRPKKIITESSRDTVKKTLTQLGIKKIDS